MLRSAIAKLRSVLAAKPAAPPILDMSDLLGRRPVSLDTPRMQRFLANKSVLVTGAGGSIGSEICRQIMRFCPRRLVLLDQAENNLFEIDRELSQRWVGADLVPALADICDRRRIEEIFSAQQPQVIFHCAAHKHVPMMESNPGEAIKNNVFGSRTVADAARASGVAAFVMVRTDKAVNPSSVMGASKRCAELYVQSLNADDCPTRFVAVRFGNVIGSSGSVVPIFRKQIDAGGPVTVTHPDMKRYFMTIAEASQLVMQAGAIGQGGEIFILDMGEPIKILSLAKEMIRRRGLKPGKDIAIEFTGIRPGEKLYEELACENEQTRPTSHPKIRVWQLARATAQQIDQMLKNLQSVTNSPHREIVQALMRSVPEYQSTTTEIPTLKIVASAA